MRILYVCSDFGISPGGTKGASVHLRAITKALSDIGHEVLLLSPKDGPGNGHPTRCVLPQGGAGVDKTAGRLKRWLIDRGYDNAVAKELRPLIYNTWAPDRAIEILSEDPPDIIVERLSLFGHVGVDLAAGLGVPHIVEVNAPLADEAERFRNLALSTLAREIQQRVLERADAVAVVSDTLANLLPERGLNPEIIHVVPNGVDMELFERAPTRDAARMELGLAGKFVVGFVGSLKEWHGVDVLLCAFEELWIEDPVAHLLIVGTGPQEERLRHRVEGSALSGAVTFTGAVPHDRIPSLLRAMDVAVAPFCSMPEFYFSPIKLFEYMASGACVVASRLGQITEVIEDGVNGLLVEPDDVHDLLGMLRYVRLEPELHHRLGTRAAETVRRRYTWYHSANALMRIIEGVLEMHRAAAGVLPTKLR